MNRAFRWFLGCLFAFSVGGCLLTIASEAIHQRELERKTREFQKQFHDQEKLKKQLEQIEAIP